MFEKVNPSHPDKVADRIAGAIVDLAYTVENNPKIAVEILIGHGVCHAIIETSAPIDKTDVEKTIHRIGGSNIECDIEITPQDKHLAENQADIIRCGDNGIFKGIPVTEEQKTLADIARDIYYTYPFDGKSRAQIFDNIKQGKYDLKSKPFDKVSSKAKDLIQKLLKVDQNERISASRALEHPWFTSLKVKEQLFDLDIEVAKKLLNNIYNYSTSNRLQKPVMTYLVHNHGEKNKFVKAATNLFTKIDINNNGSLERGEFINNTK